jgi:hypothetical protein
MLEANEMTRMKMRLHKLITKDALFEKRIFVAVTKRGDVSDFQRIFVIRLFSCLGMGMV